MEPQAKQNYTDMTKGSPFRLILFFSLPLLFGSALQQLYNMVDSIVVGRFVGHTALAAVGAAFPVIFMLASLFIGIGSGATVLVSQYYGGKEHENLRLTIDTLYTALMVGSVPLSVLGILCTNPILNLLQIPPDAREQAYIYLVIVMGGLIGTVGYNANAGILQGVGDSKTPLLFLAIACGINIVLDLFFVLVIPLGAAGVAIATIIAQAFSWIFGIVYINKRYPGLTIRPFRFRFDKRIFKEIIRIGLPAGLQMASFSIATIMLTRLVNLYGSAYAAGFAAANKLDTFAFLPIQSLSTAATTYTGQNIGAGRPDRVRAGVRASLLMSYAVSLLGLLVILFGPVLMRMFSDEAAVIDAGMAFITRIMPFYWMFATLFVLNAVMRGAGEAIVPLVSSLLSIWLVRVPVAYLFAHFLGRDNLNFSYAAGWALGMLISVLYYFFGNWKSKSVTQKGENAGPAQ